MRDQYVGDVTDALKYSLLRALIGDDHTLGVAWYYVQAHDGRRDGRHREWQQEDDWKALDPVVHKAFSNDGLRSIEAVMKAPFWPEGTLFDNSPVPLPSGRGNWAAGVLNTLSSRSVVFLDPDNGLKEEVSEKHISLSELAAFHSSGATVLFITFPRREPYHLLVEKLHRQVFESTNCKSVVTLRTSVSIRCAPPSSRRVPRPRWFTVLDPGDELCGRLQMFTERLDKMPHVHAALHVNAHCVSCAQSGPRQVVG